MRVAVTDGRIGAHHIDIAPSLHIAKIGAFAARQHDGKRIIIVSAIISRISRCVHEQDLACSLLGPAPTIVSVRAMGAHAPEASASQSAWTRDERRPEFAAQRQRTRAMCEKIKQRNGRREGNHGIVNTAI